mgnify:CR=1 FL=1
MWKVAAVIGVLAAALAAMVASDRTLPPAELTVLNRSEFNTVDPQRMSYLHDLRLAYSIYEPLVRWDNESESFDIVPAAASGWTVSGDGLEYEFRIREEASWSNGEPLTARDFVFSWRRGMLPDTVADYSGFFMHIEGAREFFDFRTEQLESYADRPESEKSAAAAAALYEEALAYFDERVGLEAVDSKTLRVRVERPIAYFLDLCAFGVFSPVNPGLLLEHRRFNAETGRIDQGTDWTKPPLLVTNGPYVPVSWRFKREMYLQLNPHYWNPGMVRSETVKIIPITDPNTSVLAFETGVADWSSDVTVDYVAEMLDAKERGEYDAIQAFGTFGTYFWSFNCEPTFGNGRVNPFHDARVRRAFVMATDKRELTENVKRSGEEPARVFVPPGSIPGFGNPEGLPYDPERAREELRAAGWEDRNGDGVPENEAGTPFPVVEMLFSTGSYHDDIALAMGRMWEQHLGVRTRLEGKELKVYKDNLKKRQYMVARGGWFGDYGDPTTFLDLHRTGDGNNDRGYSDAAFDAMMDRAAAEVDAGERMRILEEAERYTMEETLPILPVWHYNYYYLFHPPVKDGAPNPGGLMGISDHPRLVQYLWKLEVVEEGDTLEYVTRPHDMGVGGQRSSGTVGAAAVRGGGGGGAE